MRKSTPIPRPRPAVQPLQHGERKHRWGPDFDVILPYSGAHPDHHAWYQDPEDPDFILNGNDGGINISRDGGETWSFVRNLPVGQFYHINVDNDMPYNVYGGLQDNGSWKAPAYVWHGDGIRNEDWQEISLATDSTWCPCRVTPTCVTRCLKAAMFTGFTSQPAL